MQSCNFNFFNNTILNIFRVLILDCYKPVSRHPKVFFPVKEEKKKLENGKKKFAFSSPRIFMGCNFFHFFFSSKTLLKVVKRKVTFFFSPESRKFCRYIFSALCTFLFFAFFNFRHFEEMQRKAELGQCSEYVGP